MRSDIARYQKLRARFNCRRRLNAGEGRERNTRNFKQNLAHVLDIKPVYTDLIEAKKGRRKLGVGSAALSHDELKHRRGSNIKTMPSAPGSCKHYFHKLNIEQ